MKTINETLLSIIDKHETLDELIDKLRSVRNDSYSNWSDEKSFSDRLPDILNGRPGLYQIFYKNHLAYLGSTNTDNGKRSYGLHDRLQKKRAIMTNHYDNADRIMSLRETCMKKALLKRYDIYHTNWTYKYWILPTDIPLVLEIFWIKRLKKAGYCELNSQRSILEKVSY